MAQVVAICLSSPVVMLTVTLIAAISEDGYISRDHGVPWDMPDDRAHYRSHTAGKWLLLGRTTYEEMLGGWFRDHTPLVLSRDEQWRPAVGQRVSSARDAVTLAEVAGEEELVVCGGSAAFSQAMPIATQLIITRVHARLGNGVPFPPIDPAVWAVTRSTSHEGDPSYHIEWLERR